MPFQRFWSILTEAKKNMFCVNCHSSPEKFSHLGKLPEKKNTNPWHIWHLCLMIGSWSIPDPHHVTHILPWILPLNPNSPTVTIQHYYGLSMVYLSGWWLTYPSEKWWSSSVGCMKFPTEWKNKIHVPNHQPDPIFMLLGCQLPHN